MGQGTFSFSFSFSQFVSLCVCVSLSLPLFACPVLSLITPAEQQPLSSASSSHSSSFNYITARGNFCLLIAFPSRSHFSSHFTLIPLTFSFSINDTDTHTHHSGTCSSLQLMPPPKTLFPLMREGKRCSSFAFGISFALCSSGNFD